MREKWKISGSTLKMIALTSMLIDHFGAVVVQRLMQLSGSSYELWSPWYWPIRYLGRLAFPIYCFLLVEGFVHTSNVKKYFGRMAAFALLSEIPFDLGITGSLVSFAYQNVFWELSVGILALLCLEWIEKNRFSYPVQVILRLLVIGIFAAGAEVLNLDYGMYGIISMAALYVFRQKKWIQLLIGAISFCWEPVAPLAFLLIALYNGERGRSLKYVFYAFYPAHLMVLYLMARLFGCQY